MNVRILLLPLFFLTSVLHAQTAELTGTVRDREGQPLAGATVLVRGTVLGTMTDAEGRYVIRRIPSGERTLVISMLGYSRVERTLHLQAQAQEVVDVVLESTPLTTDEIVVTAGRHAQSLETIPVSVAILSAQAMEDRTLISLDQALRLVPGVNMTESQVNIRGSSGYSRGIGSRVLLLIDGIPQLAGDAGDIKFDAVPMFAVDRIEVVKGAGSALYGSSALGGVINVLTKDPQERHLHVRAYSGFYENPWHEEWKWWGDSPRFFNGLDLQVADRTDGVTWMATGGIRNNQAYRHNDDFLRWNLSGTLGWKPASDKALKFTASWADDRRGNWLYWKSVNEALVPPAGTDVSETIHSTKLQVSGQFTSTVSSDFAYALRGYVFRTAFDTESDTSDFSLRPFDRTQATAMVTGVEAQGTYSGVRHVLLIAGCDVQMHRISSTTYGDRGAMNGAFYAQSEWTPWDRGASGAAPLTLSAGLRLDGASVDTLVSESSLNPRFGAAWTPWTGTSLRASYGWGFRAPSIAERFVTASGSGLQTKPNPALRAERSTSYEFGIRQVLPFPVVVDVALFWNDYSDIIEPTLDIDGRIQFRNLTSASIRGAEVGIQGALFERFLEWSASWTAMYPLDKTLHRILRYRPRHIVQTSAQVNWKGLSLGGDYRFISRIEEIDDAVRLVIKDADQRVDAHVVDLRLAYDASTSLSLPMRLILSVNNAFQYHYSEIIGNLAPIRNYMLTVESTL